MYLYFSIRDVDTRSLIFLIEISNKSKYDGSGYKMSSKHDKYFSDHLFIDSSVKSLNYDELIVIILFVYVRLGKDSVHFISL